jgi:hypothetical protein
MNKINYLALVPLCLLFAFMAPNTTPQKKVLRPVSYKGKTIVEVKKRYLYYHFSQKEATVLEVEGPGELQLNVRAFVEAGSQGADAFFVKLVDNARKVDLHTIPALKKSDSKATTGNTAVRTSRAHKITISVPPGKHSYHVYLHKNKGEALLRAYYTAFSKPLWKEITPSQPLATYKLKYHKSGKEIMYHKISKNEGFGFSVKDSAYLRVIVRPVFDQKMLEDVNLKIKLLDHHTGEFVVYNMRTFKANNADLVGADKLTPGKAVTFYVPIPQHDQMHRYELLVERGASQALIRVSMDQNGIS